MDGINQLSRPIDRKSLIILHLANRGSFELNERAARASWKVLLVSITLTRVSTVGVKLLALRHFETFHSPEQSVQHSVDHDRGLAPTKGFSLAYPGSFSAMSQNNTVFPLLATHYWCAWRALTAVLLFRFRKLQPGVAAKGYGWLPQ